MAANSQAKTPAMNKFLATLGGMVEAGDEANEELTEIFEGFESPEEMFRWLGERWVAGGFDSETVTKAKTPPKSKKKDPHAPKPPANAYILFTSAKRAEVAAQNPTMTPKELTSHLAGLWREAGEEERAPFVAEHATLKAAYTEAMESYTPPADTTSDSDDSPKKKTARKKKAAGEPKKALNAYMHMTLARRAEVKDANPSMTNTEVTRELGRMWREMGDEEKTEYLETAAEDKERYEREMAAYNPGAATAEASPPKKAVTKKAAAKKESPKKETPKKPASKKESPKKPAAKKETTKKPAAKKETAKNATPPKKAAKKKSDAQLEEAYAAFVEVESEALAAEREDAEEDPFSAEEMEEHLNAIWTDLTHEDRLEYLESR